MIPTASSPGGSLPQALQAATKKLKEATPSVTSTSGPGPTGSGDVTDSTTALPEDFDPTAWDDDGGGGSSSTTSSTSDTVDSPATRNPAPAGVSPSTNLRITAEEGTEEDPGYQATTLSGQGTGEMGGTNTTQDVDESAVRQAADDPVHTEQVNLGATGMDGVEAMEDWADDVTGSDEAQTPSSDAVDDEGGGFGLVALVVGAVALVAGAVATSGGDD